MTFYAGAAPAGGGALTRRDGSDLLTLRLRLAHKPAVPLAESPAFRKPCGSCPDPIASRWNSPFCDAFRRFLAGGKPAGTVTPCQCAVATHYPPGNRDSSRPETSLDYLIRLGTASNRSWPRSSCCSRLAGGARTPPEELVNPASSLPSLRSGVGRGGPTDLAPPFPSHLGLSLR